MVKFDPVDVLPESEPSTLTLRTARRLLNMTRQLEEKVFHANVHVRVSSIFFILKLLNISFFYRAGSRLMFRRSQARHRAPSKAEEVARAAVTAYSIRKTISLCTIRTNY